LAGVACCVAVQADDQLAVSEHSGDPETIVHQVELIDPVVPAEPAQRYPVVQVRNRSGFPLRYSLPIKTEVCTGNKCKIVEVTMYWTAVGLFERLEYPADKPLTKKEHVPFETDDYAKLDRILRDRNSILATHSLAFLAKPVEEDSGIDAWSGATPLTVRESVVEDAAYTSWVMWHWANGEIVAKLRAITEQSCTPDYLKYLLHSKDPSCVDFALKYVMEYRPNDAQFMEDVFPILENGDRDHIAFSLRFLDGAAKNKEELHARLIESCCRMKNTYSPMVLDYFAADPDLPQATLEGLTARLDRLPYFQIHLILRLLEQRKLYSKKTQADVLRLLDGENFFIARRACEHLMKQDLDQETERKVNEFRERNRDRL
jgi:hypothetical protein